VIMLSAPCSGLSNEWVRPGAHASTSLRRTPAQRAGLNAPRRGYLGSLVATVGRRPWVVERPGGEGGQASGLLEAGLPAPAIEPVRRRNPVQSGPVSAWWAQCSTIKNVIRGPCTSRLEAKGRHRASDRVGGFPYGGTYSRAGASMSEKCGFPRHYPCSCRTILRGPPGDRRGASGVGKEGGGEGAVVRFLKRWRSTNQAGALHC
jgi:hypothetical protein